MLTLVVFQLRAMTHVYHSCRWVPTMLLTHLNLSVQCSLKYKILSEYYLSQAYAEVLLGQWYVCSDFQHVILTLEKSFQFAPLFVPQWNVLWTNALWNSLLVIPTFLRWIDYSVNLIAAFLKHITISHHNIFQVVPILQMMSVHWLVSWNSRS